MRFASFGVPTFIVYSLLAMVLLLEWTSSALAGQQLAGTTISYQGRLREDGELINGTADIQFSLWDAVLGGGQVGSTQTVLNVPVSEGLFTTSADFGVGAFDGQARWLQIAVRSPAGSGSYETLNPRQPLTAAPIALSLPGLFTQPNATSPNVVGGSVGNTIAPDVFAGTIGGGGVAASLINRVTDNHGTVGGGSKNLAGTDNGNPSDAGFATVGGGFNNVATSAGATVAGGLDCTASGIYSSVGGGTNNMAAAMAVVAGGNFNAAAGNQSTVGGGDGNTASGDQSCVPGGEDCVAAGAYSFAAGRQAKANHDGCFVWGDSQSDDIASTATRQFIVRADGGLWFGEDGPVSMPAGRFINTTTDAYLSTGGTWTSSSDANTKRNIAPVDVDTVLESVAALPISSWSYKAEDEAVRHLGPMAQDFFAAFDIGQDDTHIAMVDADGVALAAIQGLCNRLKTQAEALSKKQAELDRLQDRVAELERHVNALRSIVEGEPR